MQIDRMSPARRPDGRIAGYQDWSDLLFVHWPVRVDLLQPLVPTGLTIDTWAGEAWVGLVLFHMRGVRPWWFPAVPGVSEFHETNVRTYVHREGSEPGVWFFSLDAANSLAVRVARWRWNLQYFRSRMRLERRDDRVRYHSERLWPGVDRGGAVGRGVPGPGTDVIADVGVPPDGCRIEGDHGIAEPGTLEHFLVERYIMYTAATGGRLYRGRVHHHPYPLRTARLERFHESLVAAAGVEVPADPAHLLFSESLSVEIFPLKAIDDSRAAG